MSKENRQLKKIRLEKGLTQLKLAEKVGVSRKVLSHYETNRVNPPLKVAIKIAKVLETTVEELFDNLNNNTLTR